MIAVIAEVWLTLRREGDEKTRSLCRSVLGIIITCIALWDPHAVFVNVLCVGGIGIGLCV
jgi:hypothetical protein